jgi:dipeptidyl aminopeptidase/acylaminoacyl peptidase
MVLRPGRDQAEHLVDVHPAARFDVHPSAGILLVQPEVYHNASFYYDLYRVDMQSGRTRRLTHGGRYHFAAWSPDGKSIAASREALGVSSLQRLTPEGKPLETLWTGVDSEVVTDIGWSPDGASLVASVWRPANGWNLELFSLASHQWTALTQDKAIEAHPQFSADGASILFVSDHDGVYNVRRVYLADGHITTLTNVEGGAFRPSQATAQGPLYYTGAGADGFDLYRMDAIEEVPLSAAPPAGGAAAELEPAPRTDIAVEAYSPYSSLRPRWWMPHVAVEPGRTELGAVTSASDPLLRHIYSADVAYDFRNDWLVGDLSYVYDRWYPVFKLRAARYNTIDLDNNDDPLRVRRSDTLQAEAILPWLTYDQRWSLHASTLRVKDSDGWVAAGTSMLPDLTDNILGLALVFDSTRRYPFSISRSNGRHVQLVSENSDVLGESDYTGEVYTLDWREFFALGSEHVVALRLAGGWGTGQPRPFRLGGSRSALPAPALLDGLDFSSVFDQRDYALRGYSPGRVGLIGRRMALSSLEWRFPVRRVERGIMAPPLALHQVFGNVFVDAGAAWDAGDHPERYYTGAGIEANADTILFYNTGFNLRLGYAHGFNEGGDNRVYLRAGASF